MHHIRLSFELDVELDGLLRVLDALRDIEAPYDVTPEEERLDPPAPPDTPGGDGKPWRNRDWLHEMYVERGLTTYEVAEVAGCTQPTVCDWIHRLGIPMRQHGGARTSS